MPRHSSTTIGVVQAMGPSLSWLFLRPSILRDCAAPVNSRQLSARHVRAPAERANREPAVSVVELRAAKCSVASARIGATGWRAAERDCDQVRGMITAAGRNELKDRATISNGRARITPALEIQGVGHRYGARLALDAVSFAAEFRRVLDVSIIPPYETCVVYEVYVTPGRRHGLHRRRAPRHDDAGGPRAAWVSASRAPGRRVSGSPR
jgi:hypothetical protein